MGKFQRGRHRWKERNVAVEYKRHRWPVSVDGAVVGAIELHGSAFVAYSVKGELVGKYSSLSNARQALLSQRSPQR